MSRKVSYYFCSKCNLMLYICHKCQNYFEKTWIKVNDGCNHQICKDCFNMRGISLYDCFIEGCRAQRKLQDLDKSSVRTNGTTDESIRKPKEVEILCPKCRKKNLKPKKETSVPFTEQCEHCKAYWCSRHKKAIADCACFCTKCYKLHVEGFSIKPRVCKDCDKSSSTPAPQRKLSTLTHFDDANKRQSQPIRRPFQTFYCLICNKELPSKDSICKSCDKQCNLCFVRYGNAKFLQKSSCNMHIFCLRCITKVNFDSVGEFNSDNSLLCLLSVSYTHLTLPTIYSV
eukprot:TRINITY_DN5179_c0_g1_i1.p1 TRINITY_DN5179_c0_g1~~TRINITY_DN5179_c0_g1_i1.p1  ORF type:complete len:286 (+),score=11.93 TRINITY_DN5179_c0_g1_i1:238-1095(+)